MSPAAFLAAVSFLTRLPVPVARKPDERPQAESALFFPVVGLLLGLALWVGSALLGSVPALVTAAILLLGWVWGTGGLHLDGLADSADAWVGGIGDRERTLSIMKDPAIGTMGGVALVLVLMAKWAALTSLIETDAAVLLWLPALARTQLLVVFLTVPYAGRGGIAALLTVNLPRRKAWTMAAGTWVACLLTLWPGALGLALASAATFLLWRRANVRRLGGFTGDTAGALVELTEVAGLLAVVVLHAA